MLRRGVDAVRLAASGEADVAGVSVELVAAEQQGVVTRDALGFVDGDGVAVTDMPVVEVLGR